MKYKKKARLTLQDFIERGTLKHNSKYDYSEVNFKTTHDLVKICCPEHGWFWQKAYSHLQGIGCPQCGHRKATASKLTKESFIKKGISVHGTKYDYSKVIVSTMDKRVTIACPEHGEFKQTPDHHLRLKQGCPECGKIKCLRYGNVEDFVKRSKVIHGAKYDYSKVTWTKAHNHVVIVCPLHGEFKMRPVDHIGNREGCPLCSTRVSKWEKEIGEYIESLGFDVIYSYNKWWGKKEIDIYIPELKIGFECNGIYNHHAGRKIRSFHSEKTTMAQKAGIRLFHLWDNVDIDLNKSIAASKLGKGHFTIPAKNLKLRRLPAEQVNLFYSSNHIQGSVGKTSPLHWGLFDGGTLIAAMSFRTSKNSPIRIAELSRFATKRFYTVPGGFSKLLTTFKRWNENENTNKFVSLVSYAYRDICPDPAQSIYSKQGFKLVNKKPFPVMMYSNPLKSILYNRQQFMKRKLRKIWDDYRDDLTEKENCELHGIYQVFLSGGWTFLLPL